MSKLQVISTKKLGKTVSKLDKTTLGNDKIMDYFIMQAFYRSHTLELEEESFTDSVKEATNGNIINLWDLYHQAMMVGFSFGMYAAFECDNTQEYKKARDEYFESLKN